jgi:hypothetical protein
MKSKIWNISKEEFERIIKNNNCMSDVCKTLNMRKEGGNYRTIKHRIECDKIDISHFLTKKEIFSIKNANTVSKDELLSRLTENSDIGSVWLKNKLIKFNLLENKCSECHLNDLWNNKHLKLQLDHIDGNHFNNTLTNLRLLCPNCHSQTDTFCGKSKKTKKYKCIECNNETSGYTNICRICSMKKLRKVERPTKDILIHEIKNNTFLSLSKKYGVSDNAIRKWCKYYSIDF